ISTNCRARALFILTEDSTKYKPRLALSGNPLTECDSTNSFVFAQALPFPVGFNYPFGNNYSADLYNGQNPNLANPPDFIMPNNAPAFPESFIQPNMPVGIYTVRLNDINTGCSVVDTVSVKDKRIFPIPDILPINPVSNCDPGNPNGVARASVNGGIVGFRFDWYEGGAVAGIPVYTGVEYGQLKPIQYTVEAFNYVTGCAGTAQTTIQTDPVPIPNPTIVIESHVTSCLVDNGALSASVGGNTKDYIFDWYDGTQENPPPDFIGEYYIDLSVGPYSVTATSKITGCKSPLATETILIQQVTPEFDFVVANASCDLNNGFATIFMTSPVETSRIEWRDASGSIIAVGPNLLEAFAGIYSVTVTTILGCVNTDDVEILADIRPYNGISRTIDGQNDYFHIDCIDNYKDNIVKIFNRAGTLVYEAVGYDNSNIYFDGISNKGVSPMGTNLPDGTYFFIVDKRDGTKPIAGYLEVVR
ncbi:MAG: gliding motility-associated C-terminal domain-containing protein, partial [Cyclobacteriaceae bacterium]|nr:gliding motility-associated C-terminal domain-containing protein [Cyclobacteriaceae bacterium]